MVWDASTLHLGARDMVDIVVGACDVFDDGGFVWVCLPWDVVGVAASVCLVCGCKGQGGWHCGSLCCSLLWWCGLGCVPLAFGCNGCGGCHGGVDPCDVFGSGGVVQDICVIVHWYCNGRGHGGGADMAVVDTGGCGHN